MTSLDQLRSSLDDGLHQENLRGMLAICKELAASADRPLAFYVLASVFADLEAKWEGRPVQAAETEAAEGGLLASCRHLVFAIQRDAPEHELVDLMNRLVGSFVELQESGALG